MLVKGFFTRILTFITFCLFFTIFSGSVNAYTDSPIRPNRDFFLGNRRFYDEYYPTNRYIAMNKRAYWMPEKRERIVMDALGGNDYLF
uniref:M23 family peptidase n=1 Tax=Parastrongyloides trichosuri TaxID=131310 RepID=A0A0N5A365_PARTI